jgi:hypothetical protein
MGIVEARFCRIGEGIKQCGHAGKGFAVGGNRIFDCSTNRQKIFLNNHMEEPIIMIVNYTRSGHMQAFDAADGHHLFIAPRAFYERGGGMKHPPFFYYGAAS